MSETPKTPHTPPMVDDRPTGKSAPQAGPRIATFLASATELVCALGMRDKLVGISHECDHPFGLEDLPRLTKSRVAAPTSRAIHDKVETLVSQAMALYEVDIAALKKVAPDVLVTQDLCAVCAVGLEEVRRAASEVLAKDVTIVSLAPRRLDDVWNDLVRLGEVLGMGMTAQAIANGFRSRIDRVTGRMSEVVARYGRPKVLAIEWMDPVMVAGLWMPDLIERAGGEALVGRAGQDGEIIEDFGAIEPDVVLVKPCGFDLEQTLAELNWSGQGADGAAPLSELRRRWPKARWYAADGNAYFNRSGPRLVESLEILAACVHPEATKDFAERHRGRFVAL